MVGKGLVKQLAKRIGKLSGGRPDVARMSQLKGNRERGDTTIKAETNKGYSTKGRPWNNK